MNVSRAPGAPCGSVFGHFFGFKLEYRYAYFTYLTYLPYLLTLLTYLPYLHGVFHEKRCKLIPLNN